MSHIPTIETTYSRYISTTRTYVGALLDLLGTIEHVVSVLAANGTHTSFLVVVPLTVASVLNMLSGLLWSHNVLRCRVTCYGPRCER